MIKIMAQEKFDKLPRMTSVKSIPRPAVQEGIRLTLWISAIVGFILWGLNGGWLYAGSLFVVAAVLEWLNDWLWNRPGRQNRQNRQVKR